MENLKDIPTIIMSMTIKVGWVVTYSTELPFIKSNDSSVMWACEVT